MCYFLYFKMLQNGFGASGAYTTFSGLRNTFSAGPKFSSGHTLFYYTFYLWH